MIELPMFHNVTSTTWMITRRALWRGYQIFFLRQWIFLFFLVEVDGQATSQSERIRCQEAVKISSE